MILCGLMFLCFSCGLAAALLPARKLGCDLHEPKVAKMRAGPDALDARPASRPAFHGIGLGA